MTNDFHQSSFQAATLVVCVILARIASHGAFHFPTPSYWYVPHLIHRSMSIFLGSVVVWLYVDAQWRLSVPLFHFLHSQFHLLLNQSTKLYASSPATHFVASCSPP